MVINYNAWISPFYIKRGFYFFTAGKGAYSFPFSMTYPLFNLCIPLKMSIFVIR